MTANDRWLYVSAFIPHENARHARHAGGRVAFENLENLRRLHGAVDAVVCTTESEGAAAVPAGVTVFRQTSRDLVAYVLGALRKLDWNRFISSPVLHTRLQTPARREIERLMKLHSYAGVFVDFTQSILLVQHSAQAAGCRAPVTACVHDVFAQRLLRSNRRFERFFTWRILNDEQRLLASVDRVLTLSTKDAQLAQSLYVLREVATKAFTPPAWTARVDRSRARVDPAALLFFGNFERGENSDGAAWFADHAFDAVRAACPEVTLTLVGNGSDVIAAKLNRQGIFGTGFVEDPSDVFSRCALAVAPLFQGAGVKFKVLEALAAGLPVVGTAIALEGIDSRPDLTVASAEGFAQAVLNRLSDRTAC